MFARDLGKLDVAQRLAEHSVAIDPYCHQCLRVLSGILMMRGDIARAIEVRERYLAIATGGDYDYSMMLILSGQPEKVAQVWEHAPEDNEQKRVALALAAFAQGQEDAALAAARQLDDELAHSGDDKRFTRRDADNQYMLASLYAWMGDADRAFELLMSLPTEQQWVKGLVHLSHPVWDRVRDDPRWAEYRASIGMSRERLDAIEFDPWLPD